MEKYIRWVARLRWFIVTGWLLSASLSFLVMPDLQDIVRKTEQRFLPLDAESVHATWLLRQINPSAISLSSAVIVQSRDEGLTEPDKIWLADLLGDIDSRKRELGITSVLYTATQPELADRLLSKDGSTQLAVVSLPKADFEDETRITLNKLKQMLESAPKGASALLTGSAPLSQDFQQSSENGLRRTELITIGLVILILLIVFRSPVTSIIPLLTIGVSFVISRGLVATFAPFGVPVSHFTESFLIAVLFGAGTDYCILMILRYREELRHVGDVNPLEAISRMMSGVGRTVLFSASTVFTAFLLIGFAEFGLYRSAIGVALGMLVTVAAALTLTPALLLLFGKSLFWPLRFSGFEGHRESRIWSSLASLTAKRSIIVLLAAVICLTPLAFLFQGKRSFDDISEINPHLGSVVGFRQVEKAFSSGEVFPVTVVVTSTQTMRTTSGLAALEQASSAMTRADHVGEVRSAVRPLGRKPEELTVPGQLRQPNVGDIVKSILKDQQLLIEGLEAISLGAAPLSQGLIGIIPAIRQLESGLSKLIASQLGGLKRVAESGQQDSKESEETKAEKARLKQQAMDYYISPDGYTTKFELIMDINPYSDQAMDAMPMIANELKEGLRASALTDPKVYVTGVSAKYQELREISYRDFVRTGMLVLAGIAIVLILFLRSLVAPVYVLLSLGFNYLITMGILEFLFVKVMGYTGLSWTVSFFIFLVIVALGVDYSIFLMSRFKEEYRPGEAVIAMTKAMKTTGSIIGSAAIMMASTFGALSFSGVDTLVQIGVGTLIGLLLYATLFMGFIVPASSFLLGEANWWPYPKRNENKD